MSLSGDILGNKSYLTALIGYRNYPVSNEFVFRATFTPVFEIDDIKLWGGIRIGSNFKEVCSEV